MATRTLPMSAFSIQAARPNYAYGQIVRPPIQYAASAMLVRATIPPDIPKDATIVSAKIGVTKGQVPWTGTYTLRIHRNTTTLRANPTWNNDPEYTAAIDTVAKVDPPAHYTWLFDVTEEYANFLAGTYPNNGFRIGTTDVNEIKGILGATASANQPFLELVYAVPGAPPTDLMPDGGAVATARPIVTFTVPDETVAVQVQLNDVASATGVDFDSGEVASVSGLLNLAETAYPGLAADAATFWRARYKHADLGWSPWSTWAEFSYVPQGTLTILTPDPTPADLTPTVSWAFDRPQTAYQVRLLDAEGKQLRSSGWQSGAETVWEPSKGYSRDGQQGTIEVAVRDDVERISAPGFSSTVTARLEVTVDLDAGVPAMDALAASTSDPLPGVTLTGTRSEIPDEVVVFRNGGRVARMAGVDVFAGTAFSWTDYTAPPFTPLTYRVAPVTAGKVAKGGPTVTVTQKVRGISLLDPDAAEIVELFSPELEWEKPDVVAIHQTISGKTVRRRLGRSQPAGTLSGLLADPAGQEGVSAAAAALLEEWANDDAGRVFRLVAGDRNLPVNIGDVTDAPSGRTNAANGRVSGVSLAFWVVED